MSTAPEVFTWPFTHSFARAVTLLGDEHKEISLREPTVGDLMKYGFFDGGLAGNEMIDFISDLAGAQWSPPKVKALPAADFLRVNAHLNRFFKQAAS